MDFFELQTGLLLVIWAALLVLKLWALVDAVTRSPAAFQAADKLTKPAWMLILGLALVVHLVDGSPIGILNLLGTVAAFVYLADARPALRSLRGR